MHHVNLSSYSALELSDVLRVLKSYTTASKQIGGRAVLEDPKHPQKSSLRVEFALGSDEAFVRTFTESVIAKFFPESSKDTPEYIQNKDITGGIRIFLGDDMVDVSYEKFAHLIKNA